MTVKMNRMTIILLSLTLFFASVFLPVRQSLPMEGSASGTVSCTLRSWDFQDMLPEMVVQEKGIVNPPAIVPSSIQNLWKSLSFFCLRFIERIFAAASVSRTGFLISIVCLCILWIPSTTSHYYIISYIKDLPFSGR